MDQNHKKVMSENRPPKAPKIMGFSSHSLSYIQSINSGRVIQPTIRPDTITEEKTVTPVSSPKGCKTTDLYKKHFDDDDHDVSPIKPLPLIPPLRI